MKKHTTLPTNCSLLLNEDNNVVCNNALSISSSTSSKQRQDEMIGYFIS